jgi:hypothetical protein
MSHAKQRHHRRYLHDSGEILHREGLPGNRTNDLGRQVPDTVIATVQHGIAAAGAEARSASLGLARYAPGPWGRPPEAPRRGRSQRPWRTPYGSMAARPVPQRRRGTGAVTGHSLTRSACGWGPLRDRHVMRAGWGHRLRAVQETLALPLGEGLALAACHRMVSRVSAPRAVGKTPARERPPPVILVEGLWVTIASPPGASPHAAPGRRRAVQRTETRVVWSALGVWPDGPWDSGPGQGAAGARADTWKAGFGALSLKGRPETTTAWGGSDGAHGRARALDDHLDGVAHHRGLGHTIKPRADQRGFGALPGAPSGAEAPATRQAKRQRKTALGAAASWVSDGAGTADIRERAATFQDTGKGRAPEAVGHLLVDCAKTGADWASEVPESRASLRRTTNLLARFPKERRRQQRDSGRLQSEQGGEALWYGLASRETATQRAMLQSRL